MIDKLKPIPNHSGYYADREGNIFSTRKKKGEFYKLKPHDDHRGYFIVGIRRDDNGKSRPAKVHHLVLEAHEGPMPENHVARHLNDDSFDNRIENLKWGTKEENKRDKIVNLGNKRDRLYSDKRKTTKARQNIVKRIYESGVCDVEELCELTGWKRATIDKAIGMEIIPECIYNS